MPVQHPVSLRVTTIPIVTWATPKKNMVRFLDVIILIFSYSLIIEIEYDNYCMAGWWLLCVSYYDVLVLLKEQSTTPSLHLLLPNYSAHNYSINRLLTYLIYYVTSANFKTL